MVVGGDDAADIGGRGVTAYYNLHVKFDDHIATIMRQRHTTREDGRIRRRY